MSNLYWDEEIERMNPEDLKRLQLERLNKTLLRAKRSHFYKSRLPENVKDLSEIQDIPFTTKQDLRDSFPYKMVAVDPEKLIRLHSSSGTTGQATVIYHTKKDIDNWSDLVARCMYMTGVRKKDVFQNMMGYGLFTGGLGLHYGSEMLGSLTIPASSGNSKRQIMLMKNFKTTVIHITPSYALHLYTLMQEEGIDVKRELNLKIAFLGAEPYTEETRRRLEELYGFDAFNSYGLSEMNGPGVAFECQYKEGMHLWEDQYILEIIDPETDKVLKDGEEGEVVLTTLMREGMPIIRYKTGDIATVYPDRCKCGRTHRRISRIKGRSDDMLIINGVNLYPMQIEEILMRIPEVGHNYLIEIDKVEYLDRINIKVEVRPEIFKGDLNALESLKEIIMNEIKSNVLVKPHITLVEPNSLPASEGKAVRVIDKRK